jgi:hypothetical protein
MIGRVTQGFRTAVAQMLERDRHLLDYDAGERSITHRLGLYLEPLFPEWDVDCEYNRNGHDPKTVTLPDRSDPRVKRQTSTYPDIIIHRRGSNAHNLLIIEAKKTWCSPVAHAFDRQKVEAYAHDLNYQFGIVLKIPTRHHRNQEFSCELYHQSAWADLRI